MNAYFFIQGKINFQFFKHRIHTSYNIKIANLKVCLGLVLELSFAARSACGRHCLDHVSVRKEGRFMAIATEQI